MTEIEILAAKLAVSDQLAEQNFKSFQAQSYERVRQTQRAEAAEAALAQRDLDNANYAVLCTRHLEALQRSEAALAEKEREFDSCANREAAAVKEAMRLGRELFAKGSALKAAREELAELNGYVDALEVYGTPDHPMGVTIAVRGHQREASARAAIDAARSKP